jgi:cysteine desulfurase
MSSDGKSVTPGPNISATSQPTGGERGPRTGIKLPIYMDNHATTPTDARVLEEMLPYFAERFGNASSRNHAFGWAAEEAVDLARKRIAKLIGATPKEIIFTSGATESDNLAIKGVAEMYRERGNHIVTVVTEHRAVLDSAKRLEKSGCRVTYLPVGNDGLIDLEDIQPIAEIGRFCRERGVLFHSDVVQAVGKMPVDMGKMNLDLASISAHKLYGPKGVGALYVRQAVKVGALIDGGGHESGMRSGTLNVPGIVGLGKACAIAAEEMPQEACRLAGLRNRLKEKITGRLDEVYVNGSMENRLPGNLNLSFARIEGEALLVGLHDVAVSSGSACTTARLEPSYVLKALGLSDDLRMSSIRFGLGRFTTEAEVDYVADRVVETVERLRELSSAA